MKNLICLINSYLAFFLFHLFFLHFSMTTLLQLGVYIRWLIEVFHGGHVACQEQYNIIPMGQNVHSNAKHFYSSWHATWPPCKTSICQILAWRCLFHSFLYCMQVVSVKCFNINKTELRGGSVAE